MITSLDGDVVLSVSHFLYAFSHKKKIVEDVKACKRTVLKEKLTQYQVLWSDLFFLMGWVARVGSSHGPDLEPHLCPFHRPSSYNPGHKSWDTSLSCWKVIFEFISNEFHGTIVWT